MCWPVLLQNFMVLKSDMDVDNVKGANLSRSAISFSILSNHLAIKDKAQADIKHKNEYSSVLIKCN